MNGRELLDALRRAGVSDTAYTIQGRPGEYQPAPGALFMREQDGRWEVGSLERGEYFVDDVYATEDEAADAVYAILTKPLPPPKVETAEEAAEGHRRAAATKARMQAVIDAARTPSDKEGS
jgi:hypothetical protein